MSVAEKFILSNSKQSIEAIRALAQNFNRSGFEKIEETLVCNSATPAINRNHLEDILHTKFVQRTLIDKLDRPIYIFVLDYCFNDGTNAKVFTNQGIIMLAKPICNNAVTEILLHELGHMHNVVRTGDIRLCPNDFKGILNHDVIKRDAFLQAHWKHTELRCTYDITREKYADAYMIAGMSFITGHDVQRFNTNRVSHDTKQLSQSYFLKELL
jgi:hypothetical protein